MIRALFFYARRTQAGALTPAGMRAMRTPGSAHTKGGSLNSRKAGGLDFALLQYFVDFVQRLMCRADSLMLMKKARDFRADLVHAGWPVTRLPKLIGNAGSQWLLRWRRRYRIVRKITGMKLKVA